MHRIVAVVLSAPPDFHPVGVNFIQIHRQLATMTIFLLCFLLNELVVHDVKVPSRRVVNASAAIHVARVGPHIESRWLTEPARFHRYVMSGTFRGDTGAHRYDHGFLLRM